MKAKPASTKAANRTDWHRLRHLSDAQIRKGIAFDLDARATNEAFWKEAEVVLPTRKAIVTIRLDADLLKWFRQERGYQTRINAVLRAFMKAQEKSS